MPLGDWARINAISVRAPSRHSRSQGGVVDCCSSIRVPYHTDPIQYERIAAYVEQGRQEGATVYQAEATAARTGSHVDEMTDGQGQERRFFPPTLVTDVQSSSVLVQEEIFGPVLVAQSFRTPAEAIALANNSRFGLSAGVWTEHIGLALDVALSIKAGTVWVNCHNQFDAAAGFGGVKESGIGREGGKEGLYPYVQVAGKSTAHRHNALSEDEKSAKWGEVMPAIPGQAVSSSAVSTDAATAAAGLPMPMPTVDRTPKMYIGGKQKRPDGQYSYTITSGDGQASLGQVGDGSRKDIRDAVEAAHAAAKGWGKRAAHNRAQILVRCFLCAFVSSCILFCMTVCWLCQCCSTILLKIYLSVKRNLRGAWRQCRIQTIATTRQLWRWQQASNVYSTGRRALLACV